MNTTAGFLTLIINYVAFFLSLFGLQVKLRRQKIMTDFATSNASMDGIKPLTNGRIVEQINTDTASPIKQGGSKIILCLSKDLVIT